MLETNLLALVLHISLQLNEEQRIAKFNNNQYSYVELVEVNVVSFLYDDKTLTWNYPDAQVQHKMDVKSVERRYDYMKRHWSQELQLVFHRADKARGKNIRFSLCKVI